MKNMKEHVFTMVCLLFYSFISNAQGTEKLIYSKDVVYKYEITHIQQSEKAKKSKMYMVCYAIPWIFDSLRQVKINWAYNLEEVFEPTPGTGAVENDDRIWLHPPRKHKFSILEYSPFPYVKLPVKMKEKWIWELSLGKYWANKDLGVKGEDRMKYEYFIVGQVELMVKFLKGSIKCYKIKAHSINPKFKSELVSYFNPKYGFVKMEYNNIDESNMQFELVDIPSMQELEFLNTYISK
jgi:hypothetical protein